MWSFFAKGLDFGRRKIISVELSSICSRIDVNDNFFFLICPESSRKLIHLKWIVCWVEQFACSKLVNDQNVLRILMLKLQLKLIKVSSLSVISFFVTWNYETLQIKGARSRYFRQFCLILSIMSSKRQIGRAKCPSFAKSRPHKNWEWFSRCANVLI